MLYLTFALLLTSCENDVKPISDDPELFADRAFSLRKGRNDIGHILIFELPSGNGTGDKFELKRNSLRNWRISSQSNKQDFFNFFDARFTQGIPNLVKPQLIYQILFTDSSNVEIGRSNFTFIPNISEGTLKTGIGIYRVNDPLRLIELIDKIAE